METVESKLKELILDRYGSLKKFTDSIGMPWTTLDSILKRGIICSNINNVIKISEALNISATELALGRIETTSRFHNIATEINELNAIIDLIPKSSIEFLSYLCKNRRIIDDCTEKFISINANIKLNDYLSFENDNKNIGARNIMDILNFLEFNTSYIIGFINGLLLSLEPKNNNIDILFNEKINHNNLKEKFFMICILDPKEWKRIFDKEEYTELLHEHMNFKQDKH